MRKLDLIFIFLAFSFCTINLNAQNHGTISDVPFESFSDNSLSVTNFFEKKKTELRTNSDTEFNLVGTTTDLKGNKHYRYKQEYKGIPFFGNSYILHEKDGIISSANGRYFENLILDTQASFDPSTALSIAKSKMDAQVYADDDDLDHISLQIIDKAFPRSSQEYKIVYVLELHSLEPFDKKQFIIDAKTKEILHEIPLIHDQGVPSKGMTSYYGEKSFIVDSIAPNKFHLHDPTRGKGITTYTQVNDLIEEIHSDVNYWDLSDEKRGNTAVDVHWATQGFYDMLIEKLSWDGLDNAGRSMNPVVHAFGGLNFVNAFWDGTYAYFGDGDCNFQALTSIEIVGHEFAHGITQETANLIYSDESGAINESMSDVLGKALEYYLDKDGFTWLIGDDITESPFAEPIRNMADPSTLGHPAFYKGIDWIDGAGVHTNSAIGNLWFQILVDGKTGINEDGEAYDANGIGMDKALTIAFTCLSSYLTESSNYASYYVYSLDVTRNLFGAGSTEYASVEQAWKAVGLNDSYDPDGSEGSEGLDLNAQVFSNSGIELFTCLTNEFLPVEISVINTGTIDYIPSMNGELEINISNEDVFVYPLDTSLAVGDTLDITFSDIIYFEGQDIVGVSVVLKLQDDINSLNNDAYAYIENSDKTELDLSFFLLSYEESCSSQDLLYTYYIINESCTALASNSNYLITIYDDNNIPIHLENYVTDREIAQFGFLSDVLHLNKEMIGSNIPITAVLELEEDMFLDNNSSSGFISTPTQTNKQQFLNSFSDESDLTNHINFTSLSSADALTLYQGESYLSTTGSESGSDNYCSDPFILFYEDLSWDNVNARLDLCLNLEDLSGPILKFDLVQFREQDLTYPDLLTSICKLTIKSEDDTFEDFFYELEEGELYNYAYPLPNGFRGEISFQFFNRNGKALASEFFEGDVILMDNLEISGIVATDDDPKQKSYASIFPNPVEETLHLKLGKKATAYSITNAQGIIIKRGNLAELNSAIDIGTFASGYYILNLEYSDRDREAIPFIHLNR